MIAVQLSRWNPNSYMRMGGAQPSGPDHYTGSMEIYLVGGAVRDALLGLDVKDRDWVVVGSSPQEMVKQGFLPVGKDFPVFLHPVTHEEYALARTERKTAPGYKGFVVHASPQVTLEQDLARRDLTINAIAAVPRPANTGLPGCRSTARAAPLDLKAAKFIDPFGGRLDLAARLLRHVSDAFREDPVRILRVARFAARFADFSVVPQTMQLMRDMVSHGEVDHLVTERVWQEISNGLMTPRPSRMFDVLAQCGALTRLVPGFEWHSGASGAALDLSADSAAPLAVRYACLYQPCAGFDRWRVPTDCSALADMAVRESANLEASRALDAHGLMELLERCDAIRQPTRFSALLLAFACGAQLKPRSNSPVSAAEAAERQAVGNHLLSVLAAARGVPTEPVAARAQAAGASGLEIGSLIRAARLAAIAQSLVTSASAP